MFAYGCWSYCTWPVWRVISTKSLSTVVGHFVRGLSEESFWLKVCLWLLVLLYVACLKSNFDKKFAYGCWCCNCCCCYCYFHMIFNGLVCVNNVWKIFLSFLFDFQHLYVQCMRILSLFLHFFCFLLFSIVVVVIVVIACIAIFIVYL